MTAKIWKISIYFPIVLQLSAINNALASKESHISSCKTYEYYDLRELQLFCTETQPSTDIFTNTSTTATFVCEDKSTNTDWVNGISFTNCVYPSAPIELFNYFSLDTVGLQSMSLERIDKFDFVDTPRLKKLLAFNNSITRIPAKLFRHTPQIQSVFLARNRISRINPKAFNTTHKITFLDLGRNNIRNVSKALLDTMSDLETLYLEYNNISDIEPFTFSGIRALDVLDLTGNKLERVTSNMFAGLWRIWTLGLSSNNIKRIDGNAFSALRSLMTLELNSNQIDGDGIQPDAFNGLVKVFRLELNNNKLTTLRDGMFDGLPGLQYLELHGNPIATIMPLAFNHPDLHDLDLSSTYISQLNAKIFSHAPKIANLNLSYTNVADIPADFVSSVTVLYKIDLSYCAFKSIDFERFLPIAGTIHSLYLDGNELTELTEDIREILPNLRNLGITNNNFSCSHLREIYRTIGSKVLSESIQKYPIGSGQSNVNGIGCKN